MICPAVAAALDRLGDRAFERRMGLEFLQRFRKGARMIDPASMVGHFSDRDAGVLILFALMLQADEEDVLPSDAALPLSIAALARRFKVSRTHVLRLIRDAEAAGLISRIGERGEQILFAPQLREDLRRFFAGTFQLAALCALAALREDRR
jgi:hypothetical protein